MDISEKEKIVEKIKYYSLYFLVILLPFIIFLWSLYNDSPKGDKTFHGYDCTENCSGHQAGYEWAEEKGINDEDDCGGNSTSFVEGCKAYVYENY